VPDWVIYSVVLLVGCFAALNGVLMLVVPRVHRKFLSWMMRADSWSLPARSSPRRESEIEGRLAGLILAGMGFYFGWGAIAGLVGVKPLPESTQRPTNIGGDWFTMILGTGAIAFGVYAIARPDSLVSWSIKHQPTPREIPDSTLRAWRIGAKALGAAFVLGGLYALRVTFAHAVR